MLVITNPARAELTVKNSRFLSETVYVETPEEARDIWRFRKSTYDNGGHIVYAFIVGPQGNIMGCSDDGEPGGTAGRPTLEVLKGSGITNVLLTTARWFGGTKLGTGGLVHAYCASAQAVLECTPTRELLDMTQLEFTVSYALYEQVKRLLNEAGFEVSREDFAQDVRICGQIISSRKDSLRTALRDISAGKIVFE